jgi:alpha-L-arabinofuranosidase
MTAVSDLVNGWSGGIIQASRHDTFVTPTYLVIRLYNETLGTDRLAARVESPTFNSSIEGTGVPVLDAIATRSADGSRVYVRVVNTSRNRALKVTVTVTGTRVGARGTIQTVTGDSFEAANSFRTPHAITERAEPFRTGGKFSLELPPHSVSVLTLPTN